MSTYVDDVVVFGHALLAHETESSTARDPRIVLAPSAVLALNTHLKYYQSPKDAPHTSLFLKDADGQIFLNYLYAVLYRIDDTGPDLDALLRHKSVVELRLIQYKPRPSIWSKYAWVAGYHNYFCDENSAWFDDSHRIDLSAFRAPPSSILDE